MSLKQTNIYLKNISFAGTFISLFFLGGAAVIESFVGMFLFSVIAIIFLITHQHFRGEEFEDRLKEGLNNYFEMKNKEEKKKCLKRKQRNQKKF